MEAGSGRRSARPCEVGLLGHAGEGWKRIAGFWVGLDGFWVWAEFWFWVSGFLSYLLFQTKLKLFEFKLEFELNPSTQTNKTMHQHECNNKFKPRKILITL